MNESEWVLMSEALKRVTKIRQKDADPDQSARMIILKCAKTAPTRAAVLEDYFSEDGCQTSNTLRACARIHPNFWEADFGRNHKGPEGIRGERFDDCSWDWNNSAFTKEGNGGGPSPESPLYVFSIAANGVEIHWPSLVATMALSQNKHTNIFDSAVDIPPRGRGRPLGSGKMDDGPIVEAMAQLIANGFAKSPWAAATMLADQAEGNATYESKRTRIHARYMEKTYER